MEIRSGLVKRNVGLSLVHLMSLFVSLTINLSAESIRFVSFSVIRVLRYFFKKTAKFEPCSSSVLEYLWCLNL